jgi:hypothetical protein
VSLSRLQILACAANAGVIKSKLLLLRHASNLRHPSRLPRHPELDVGLLLGKWCSVDGTGLDQVVGGEEFGVGRLIDGSSAVAAEGEVDLETNLLDEHVLLGSSLGELEGFARYEIVVCEVGARELLALDAMADRLRRRKPTCQHWDPGPAEDMQSWFLAFMAGWPV